MSSMFGKRTKDANEHTDDIEAELCQRFNAAVDITKVVITPEEIDKLTLPTKTYLCPKSANIYDIEFTKFRVRDFSQKQKSKSKSKTVRQNNLPILIDISKPVNYVETEEEKNDPTSGRFVRYHLHKEFLDLRSLGAQITFTVGGTHVVKKFRMIEKHYFKGRLVKTFDFNFGAALIPNSENSIEHIYELPKLDKGLKQDMVDSPWETKSDSFYFVENRLIMHNKAEYAYNYTS